MSDASAERKSGGSSDVAVLETLFDAVAGCPRVSSGRLELDSDGSVAEVLVATSEKDARSNETRTFHQTFVRRGAAGELTAMRRVEPRKALASVPSPSGRLTATVYAASAKSGAGTDASAKPDFNIVVADETQVVRTISTKGCHGQVFLSGTFGGFAWSRDETRIAYIAEPLPKDRPHFFSSTAKRSDGGGQNKVDQDKGDAFEHQFHWGEIQTQAMSPRVYIADVGSGDVWEVVSLPQGRSYGQVTWSPDGCGVVVVGWDETPRRFGVTYYNTRKSALVYGLVGAEADEKDASGKDEKESSGGDKKDQGVSWSVLTPADHSALNPRFSPDGKSLLYTTTDAVWYHLSCSRLRVLTWTSATAGTVPTPAQIASNARPRTVVDVVDAPADGGKGFPGVWAHALPRRVWLGDSKRVAIPTRWRSIGAVIVVDVDTGSFRRVIGSATLPALASLFVLDVAGAHVLLEASAPNLTPQVHLLTVAEGKRDEATGAVQAGTWVCLAGSPALKNAALQEALERVTFRILELEPPADAQQATDEGKAYPPMPPVEAIVLLPPRATEKPCPVVLRPHGGPHSASCTAFDWGNALMLLRGMAVVLVNYRGSVGFGMNFLRALPGRCGEADVADCLQALREALALGTPPSGAGSTGASVAGRPKLDAKRLAVWGGSHGGFLTTHLIGQKPDLFSAAATRNPVTNIAFMTTSTDIPDWCYTECGRAVDGALVPTEADYRAFYAMSPIAHVRNVKTPLLVMLGLKDLRVPPEQGLDYYRTLRARGVEARCLTYPDSTHSLSDSVRTEADVWINVLQWFARI